MLFAILTGCWSAPAPKPLVFPEPTDCAWGLARDAIGEPAFAGRAFVPSIASVEGELVVTGLRRGEDGVERVHVMTADGWREQLAVPGIRASIGPDGHGALHLLVMQSDLGSTARVRRQGEWSEPRALPGHYFVGPIVPAPDGPRVLMVPDDVEGAWHLGAPGARQPEPAWAAGGRQSVEPAVALDEAGAALFWLDEGHRPVVANRDGTRWEPGRVHGTWALGLKDGAPRLVTELAAGVSVLAPTGSAVELARNHLTAADDCPEGPAPAGRCEMAWESVQHSVLDLVPTEGAPVALLLRQTTTATALSWECLHGSTTSTCRWQPSEPKRSSSLLVGSIAGPLHEVALGEPIRDGAARATRDGDGVHVVVSERLEGPLDHRLRAISLTCR